MAARDGRAGHCRVQHQGRPLNARLAADCGQCFGLCCAALPFSTGAAFPEDKAAGQPCRNLLADFRCGIHSELASSGWHGCVTFDCFGAGQQVSQVTYAGRSWRELPELAPQMYAVFGVMRQLHEMLFLAGDPVCAASSYAPEAAALEIELDECAAGSADELLVLDLAELRGRAGELFRRVAGERGGVSHRGAWLMAADLRDADLTDADLLGADLRDTDLRGANVERALFLTQAQLNAARGDGHTGIPDRLNRPARWLTNANHPG